MQPFFMPCQVSKHVLIERGFSQAEGRAWSEGGERKLLTPFEPLGQRCVDAHLKHMFSTLAIKFKFDFGHSCVAFIPVILVILARNRPSAPPPVRPCAHDFSIMTIAE